MIDSTIKRKSILDDLDNNSAKNIFCNVSDLTNEASVETFFINRLLKELRYKDCNILT